MRVSPPVRSRSAGYSEPGVRAAPASTTSPSSTSTCVRRGKVYSLDVPSSAITVSLGPRSPSCDLDAPGDLGDARHALGLAGLEQLDHARQAVGDVGAGHAAGVEGAHGELGARLADGLRGDVPDRVADVGFGVGGQAIAVAVLADAVLGVALEHAAHRHHRVGLLAAAEELDDPGSQSSRRSPCCGRRRPRRSASSTSALPR